MQGGVQGTHRWPIELMPLFIQDIEVVVAMKNYLT